MVSGFHRAQHHSASLFLYLSFIHSLSLSFVSLFFVASHTQLSVYVHIPFVPVFSLPLALSLSLFVLPFIPSIAFLFVRSLPRFIYHSLSLSLPPSLPRSIPLSRPQQVQNNISGVDQIFQAHMDSTDGHKS